jgi:hypothetical protein
MSFHQHSSQATLAATEMLNLIEKDISEARYFMRLKKNVEIDKDEIIKLLQADNHILKVNYSY